MERITTLVNSSYLERNTAFPRQRAALEKLERAHRQHHFDTNLVRIIVAGDTAEKITGNIALQLREVMDDFYDNSVVNFTGDSLAPLVMEAFKRNLETRPVTSDNHLDPKPVIFAPGGTMNLLPKELGTANIGTVAAMACGAYPFDTQEVKIRHTIVRTFDHKSRPSQRQTFPWTSFAGGKLDGYIMEQMEDSSRRRPPLLRMFRAAAKALVHGIRKPPQLQIPEHARRKMTLPVGIISYIAIPALGPYRFDRDTYNTLDQDHFHRIIIEANAGLDAVMKWLTFSALATNPALGKSTWDHLESPGDGKAPWYHFPSIMAAVKPQRMTEDLQFHSFNEPILQIDGYPIDMRDLGLRPEGYATTYTTTSDQSFIAAKACNPERMN